MQLAFWYQLYRARGAEHEFAYYALVGCGIVSYMIGLYFHKQGDAWASTLSHGGTHVFANCANVALYSGRI